MIVELRPVATTEYQTVLRSVGHFLAARQLAPTAEAFVQQVQPWPQNTASIMQQGIRVVTYAPPASADPRIVTAPLINELSFQRADRVPLWLVVVLVGQDSTRQPEFIQLVQRLTNPQAAQELHQLPPSLLTAAMRRMMVRDA
ncbi:hypothetical protein [Schleiferilactobacillus shenzhenensis]|nr:hypothetical protein [Schleiferilactobacillus shenzhenensis]